jgi:uncharacterized protein YjcR
MVDWEAIKKEYIAGGTSYAKLVRKYGVPMSKIRRTSAREGWVQLRAQVEEKANASVVDEIAKEKSRCSKMVVSISGKLLDKLNAAVEHLPPAPSAMTIQQLTSALKSLKDVVDHKSELDVEEQKARIRKLEADCKKATEVDGATVIKVEFDQKEWSE